MSVKNLQDVKHFYNVNRDEIMLVHQPYTKPGKEVRLEALDATFHAVAAVTAWAIGKPLDEIGVLVGARAILSTVRGKLGLRSLRAVATRETLIGDDIVRVTVQVLRPSADEWEVIREARAEEALHEVG